jgi:uncharacterized repeat protein (TIGR03803 family)
MRRIVTALDKLNWGKRAFVVFVLCATTAITLPAQTLTTLFSFDGTDGSEPKAGLVQATNGDFYGTTYEGGANGGGTVFKITPGGTLTTLYSFCGQNNCTDGELPAAGLVQATNGDFYGTTYEGGANRNGTCFTGCGTVFKITPSGTLTTLYSFCAQGGVLCTDGDLPTAGLVQATDGDFYGTTYAGGANLGGTVFKITPSGMLTTLYSFCPKNICTHGQYPEAGLIQATNGDLYGTTYAGGANGDGTIFKITPSGTLTTLHSFDNTDGANPDAGLVQGINGDFYGTSGSGGANLGGTIFKITPSGTLTTLYSFCSQSGCTDGDDPSGVLIQATDGDFYGTTEYGGAINQGTVFKITPGGALTTLYSFCSQSYCPDGLQPIAGLIQDTTGILYGTTSGGSEGCGVGGGCGTVFSLSVGLGPFVETQRTSGMVGEVVKILGTDLTGATSVSFNGTVAAFTVVAPSLITATVPTGATSGTVQVVTPSGTLSSNVPFRVLP